MEKPRACARRKSAPVAYFPAHWAPNGMVLYNQKAIPRSLPAGPLHRLSRFVESRPVRARRLQRRVSRAVGRQGVGQVRDIRRRICRSRQIAGQSRASSERTGGGTRWRTVCVRRCGRPHLSYRPSRRRDAGSRTDCALSQRNRRARTDRQPRRRSRPRARILMQVRPPPELIAPPGATPAMVALGDRVYHGRGRRRDVHRLPWERREGFAARS